MTMVRSPLLVQRFKDPEESIRNGFAHQLGVIGSQPLPKAGRNLRRQARLVEDIACDKLRLLTFVRGIRGDVGQCGQHARFSKSMDEDSSVMEQCRPATNL